MNSVATRLQHTGTVSLSMRTTRWVLPPSVPTNLPVPNSSVSWSCGRVHPQEYSMECNLCGHGEATVSVLPDDPRGQQTLFWSSLCPASFHVFSYMYTTCVWFECMRLVCVQGQHFYLSAAIMYMWYSEEIDVCNFSIECIVHSNPWVGSLWSM